MDASSPVLAGASAAFVVGLTGSVHCLLMCGPLACAAVPGVAGDRRRAVAAYQVGRVSAYGALGAALGALGGGVTAALAVSARPYLPWVMAAALVASALELGKRLRPLPGLARAASALARLGAKVSPTARAAAIGAATPLLPCGLLYGVFAAALTAGSASGGALVLGSFSLGAIPALLGAQVGAGRGLLRSRWAGVVLQRALPLAAAAVLVYRAIMDPGAGGAPRCH